MQIDLDVSTFNGNLSSADKTVQLALETIDSLSVGGGTPDIFYNYPAGTLNYPVSNPAVLDTDSGSNGVIKRLLFDDTTAMSVYCDIQMPASLTGYTKAYFECVGYSVTAAASKVVEFIGYHSAKNNAESWDAAFTAVQLGVVNVSSTQDQLDVFSFGVLLSTLDWVANDNVRIKLERDTSPTSGTDLTGNYGIVHFRIRLSAT